MTVFENIVRPFQRKDVTPPTRIVGKEKVVEPVPVAFGKGGGKVLDYGFSFTPGLQTTNLSDTYKEIKRDNYPKRRVENPDDSSQFVEVESVKKIYTRNLSDPKVKRNYEFKDSSHAAGDSTQRQAV